MYKRIIALFSIIVLCIATISPSASATTVSTNTISRANTQITKEEIEQIAIIAFPEHATKIQSSPTSTATALLESASSTDKSTVVFETRTLSDFETITYQEYSDSTYSLLFSSYSSTQNSTVSGDITAVNKTVWTTYSLSNDVNYIENFCYHIVSDSYDYITNTGSPWGTTFSPMRGTTKLNENASGSAYVNYECKFTVNIGVPEGELNTVQSTTLKISVGNNTFSMSFT